MTHWLVRNPFLGSKLVVLCQRPVWRAAVTKSTRQTAMPWHPQLGGLQAGQRTQLLNERAQLSGGLLCLALMKIDKGSRETSHACNMEIQGKFEGFFHKTLMFTFYFTSSLPNAVFYSCKLFRLFNLFFFFYFFF